MKRCFNFAAGIVRAGLPVLERKNGANSGTLDSPVLLLAAEAALYFIFLFMELEVTGL